jgi:SAM-dependent methyltransferase
MDDRSWRAVEERTRAWLDAGLRAGIRLVDETRPTMFDPTTGSCRLTAYQFQVLQRRVQIFRLLDRLEFATLVDVGSGWESYPRLVRERYGAAAFYADFNHMANLPLGGFPSDRLDRAVTANVARLPFPDGAFDVVLCAEVLEHLVRPVEAIAELLRIARQAVILTSLEALAPSRWQRRWSHFRTDVSLPHVERNFFSMRELRLLFGETSHYESLFDSSTLPAGVLAPEEEQRAAYDAIRDTETLIRALSVAASGRSRIGRGTSGILVMKRLHGCELAAAREADEIPLAAWLVAQAVANEREPFAVLDRYRILGEALKREEPALSDDAVLARVLAMVAPDRRRPVSADLLRHLCCPDCRTPLTTASDGVRCPTCASDFATDYGVPVLDPKRLPEGRAFEEACVERVCDGEAQRRRGVRRIMRRLRRNERPAGRLRRSVWTVVDAAERRRRSTRA